MIRISGERLGSLPSAIGQQTGVLLSAYCLLPTGHGFGCGSAALWPPCFENFNTEATENLRGLSVEALEARSSRSVCLVKRPYGASVSVGPMCALCYTRDMDVEQTMRFILDTQARLEASVGEHHERIAENERQIQANTNMIRQLVDVSLSLVHNMEEGFREARQGFQQIREIQAASEYKLNALIETVDKLVHRNGHNFPQQP
jgi:hypothetical protein